jgi:hypothetical protein
LNQSGLEPHLYSMVGMAAVEVADIVQAAATGDESAFTELVTRHHQDMLRVAYVICREPALVESQVAGRWQHVAGHGAGTAPSSGGPITTGQSGKPQKDPWSPAALK